MIKKYLQFYGLSLFIIFGLVMLFFMKMNSTYEAKHNSKIFQSISSQFLQHQQVSIDKLDLENKANIHIQYQDNSLIISILHNDYRKCLKYGVDYMNSNFSSILINETLFTRKDVITRDIILDKCNKTFNNITLSQKMEKK